MIELHAQSKADPGVLKTNLAESVRNKLRILILELKQESGACAHNQGYIAKACSDAVDKRHKVTLKKSYDALTKRLNTIMKSISVYAYVRVLEVTEEMNSVRTAITALENEVEKLTHEVEAKRKSLATLSSNFILRRKNALHIEKLRGEITRMIDDINRKEVVVSEESLLEWLDAIIDANFSNKVVKQAHKTTNLAKLSLFSLLQKYCMLQEANARRVARNPFSQIDPKQSIQYILFSEKFILDYFIKKRDYTVKWLGYAADAKLKELDKVEQGIMHELRISHKLAK